MTEVLERVSIKPMCPSCERPMEFQEDWEGWRCLACKPIPMEVKYCKTVACKRPLTHLGPPWNNDICLHCNEHPAVVNARNNKTELPDHKYIDITMTEEKVSEMIKKEMAGIGDIVREAISEFNLKEGADPDYPQTSTGTVPSAGITQLPETQTTIKPSAYSRAMGKMDSAFKGVPLSKWEKPLPSPPKESQTTIKPETWLQKAKRLGVQTHNEGTGGMRKKVDIMTDMEKVKGVTNGGNSNSED